MGDLSLHFSKSEFRCRCGKCDVDGSIIDSELIVILELIRAHFSAIAIAYDARITVNSGHRCPTHNRNVGGAPSSQHLAAKAADIVVEQKDIRGKWQQVSPVYIYEWMREMFPARYGLCLYDTFNHIDTRQDGLRRDYRTKI